MRSSLFLKTHRRENRNPYFRFHPLQASYALFAVLILTGLLAAWFLLSQPAFR
jgi:hypothetical protein